MELSLLMLKEDLQAKGDAEDLLQDLKGDMGKLSLQERELGGCLKKCELLMAKAEACQPTETVKLTSLALEMQSMVPIVEASFCS